MAALANASWRIAVMGRWTARILGTLIVLLFLALLVGEGMPAVSQLTASEKLSFLGMAGLTVGLLLAWKWEGLGGMVSVAGFALLVAIGREHLRMWAFWLPALVAIVHILCWERLRTDAPAGLAPWRLSRTVVLGLLALLALFLLLCANEIFVRPPLMTPALSPSADLVGTWRATPAGTAVVLTIHADAAVTGQVGGIGITEARIVRNRSWFGKLMHFNSEYLIEGALASEVRVSERAAGKQFTIPLSARGEALDGSLFLAGQPWRLSLERQ
ncbi:MAG: hypothetical protein ABSH49_01805 [Bryobacteraceae bacterium]|jgi:hypothetical protein